ncbi:hypothetical protein [Gloeothece verrucosa]|uniref:Chromosome segregation ATPase-like protein n=1 Tax=Gloeothece verrucosa (strain PCC 7822) TaxID=497965 RepID=E0UD11_GLOV7|nr:hypothetical protein [Gloeothece verrucosa]ADN16476.1 hypothetical protein Cyan7822_4567 [Gloeothece verrucosa PCC 7822]
MSSCESLATKAEVAALRAELRGGLASKPSNQEIINIVNNYTQPMEGVDFSGIFSAIGALWAAIAQATGQIADVRGVALQALGIARAAFDLAGQALDKAGQALSKALEALDKAKNAEKRAIAAELLAQECLKVANRATEKANEAIEKANLSIKQANKALYQANQAMKQANLAYAQAIEAYKNAEVWGVQGVARANGAYLYAQEVARSANQAYARALQAQADASKALQGLKNLSGLDVSGLQKLKSSVEALQAQNLINIERAIQNSHRADIERLRTAQTIGNLENQVSNYRTLLGQQGSVINSVQNNVTRVISGGGGAGIDSIKNDLSVFNQKLSDYDQKLGDYAYNAQTFNQKLSDYDRKLGDYAYNAQTFNQKLSDYDRKLGDYAYNAQTFNQKLSDYDRKLGDYAYNAQTFNQKLSDYSSNQTIASSQTNNKIGSLETTVTNLSNTQTQTNNKIGSLETTVTNLSNTQTQTNNKIGSLETTITNLSNTQTQTNNKVATLDTTVTNLSNTLTQTNNKVAILDATITNLSNTQTQTNNKVATLESSVTNIQTQVNEVDVKVTDEVKKLGTTIDGLVPVIGGIAISTNLIKNQTSLPKLAEAAETGVCNASKPEGCLGAPLKQMKNGIDTSVYNTAGIGGLALQNAAILNNTIGILNLLNTVWAYLQTFSNFVTGKFEKLWEHRLVDRALAAANLACTIHNALMLSNNIALTLGSAIDNIGQLIGIKPPEGAATTITGAIGHAFESLAKSVIGAENYAELSLQFALANRIYQAGINILDAATNMLYGISEGLETIAQMGGKIGNACKKSGLFIESSLDWFSEKFVFKIGRLGGIMRFLQTGQVMAESVEQITSSALNVVESAKQITTEVKDVQKDIKDLQDKRKADENKAKTDSKQPTTTDDDIVQPSPN